MEKAVDEVIDSQFLAEHVGFLDNCFDNSFVLQSSLLAVKEYVTEELEDYKTDGITCKKINSSIHKKPATLETSACNTTSSQVTRQNIVNKNLKNWGLPEEIVLKYEQRGITEMFDWQVTCLANSKVLLDYCNLVYSAPTSAGKTLVAEILTIKTILERQKKVIIILPFVSIVREKTFYLQDILSSSGIRVEGFMGSQSPPGGLQAVHVAICTIEKANSLVNRLLDDGNISELGAVVVDELHLLGDPHRGYILELLLTKIKYVSSRSDSVKIQIVGMSATLPNLEVLASWLSAELFVTQFRPIPLDEYCLVGNKYYNKYGTCVSSLNIPKSAKESDSVLNICLETIKESCSILIFCMTKNRCENLSQTIASSFCNLGRQNCEFGSVLRSQLKTDCIAEVLEQLKNCPVGLDLVMKQTISFGVAYHHAGLTFDERDIIEGAFKSGAIRVLVATSTLSSGVNLPARKVIIRSPVFMREPINILTYKQMIGRAGRMGKDTKGESILICTDNEKKIGFGLMMRALDPVKSCIETADKYMRAVLEMIASQVICTKDELDLYSKCTLLFAQQNLAPSQNKLLENTLEELKNYELVRVQSEKEDIHYVATSLGKACLSASMAPIDGLSLFLELQKARQCLVLETDLHLIYLVTPYSVSSQWGEIDWLHLLTLWEPLTKAMKRVGELVGVQESFIIRCLRGTNKLTNVQNKLNIHKRFYTALALQDLVNEMPLSEVAMKFRCARGFLQSLQQAAATFAGMVTAFCRQLGWKNMEILISQFQDRLHFGIHSELLELMKLPSLNGVRARTLFDSGYETVSNIASADVNVIENILHKAVPFLSEKEREDEDSYDMKKRNKIKSIWITGCCGMTANEAAQNLIIEARKHLENEIGVTEIKWNTNVSNFTKPNEEAVNASDGNQEDTTKHIKNTIQLKDDGYFVNSKSSKDCIKFEDKLYDNSKSTKDCIQFEDEFCDSAKSSKNTIRLEDHAYSTKLKKHELKQSLEFNEKSVESDQISGSKTKSSRISLDLLDISAEEVYISANSCNIGAIQNQGVSIKEEIVYPVKEISQDTIPVDISTIQPEVAAEKHSTPIIEINSIPETICNASTAIKDEIVWDSLNFTEAVMDNIIKLRTSEKDFSPNISFGDTDISATSVNVLNEKEIKNEDSKATSVKDVSLFSTDGDNSSIFEESLPLDLIPSRLLDNRNMPADSANLETTADFMNFNSILDGFKSPIIETDEDCDIKLIFEEDENDNCPGSLNISTDNEVVCSQENVKTIAEFKSPYNKRRHKDVMEDEKHIAKRKKYADVACRRTQPAITKTTIRVSHYRLDCVLIHGNDVRNKLRVLERIQTASVSLKLKQSSHLHEVIGSEILNVSKQKPISNLILGMALYIGNDDCIFLDQISLESNKNVIKSVFESKLRLNNFSLKTNYLHLLKELGVQLPSTSTDVCTAEWLTKGEKTLSYTNLMKHYCGVDLTTANINVDGKKKKITELNLYEDLCIEAWCLSMIDERQANMLQLSAINQNVIGVENHVATILASSEYYGITVDRALASQMLIRVKRALDILQKYADKQFGRGVNLNSHKCVAKALGIHKQGKVTTKKSVLMSQNSPLSSVVIFWRKLNCILTKTLFPLSEQAHICRKGDKINPTYMMYTSTGRISMHEPNLQNVPRTFSIPNEYLEVSTLENSQHVNFNCRKIFKASEGYVMVSADYCQLEMRILTHLSEDNVLLCIMRSDVDVFKSIATSWSGVPENEVDDDLRNKAKQLCYGILYGMGNTTLAQHLAVIESQAHFFMNSFYETYPDVKKYTDSVKEACKKSGYVETLMKRRRYLPDIKHKLSTKRAAAQRKAVNTTIQGSAADIAKAAMCAVDKMTKSLEYKPRLLLQMHDELIYEVPKANKQDFCQILKEAMEKTVKLKVPLPVKVKSGYTWGTLEEVKL